MRRDVAPIQQHWWARLNAEGTVCADSVTVEDARKEEATTHRWMRHVLQNQLDQLLTEVSGAVLMTGERTYTQIGACQMVLTQIIPTLIAE